MTSRPICGYHKFCNYLLLSETKPIVAQFAAGSRSGQLRLSIRMERDDCQARPAYGVMLAISLQLPHHRPAKGILRRNNALRQRRGNASLCSGQLYSATIHKCKYCIFQSCAPSYLQRMSLFRRVKPQ
jgi:hypothetical protein